MNPLSNPTDIAEATERINAYARNDWAKITIAKHAKERQRERVIPYDVLLLALREGTVTDYRTSIVRGELIYSYRVVYRDKYGEIVAPTIILGPMRLLVKTTWDDD